MSSGHSLTAEDRGNWRSLVHYVADGELDPAETCTSCGSSIPAGGLAEFHLWATVQGDDLPYHAHGPVCWKCSGGEIGEEQMHTDARTCLAIGRITQTGDLADVKIHAVEAPSDSAAAQTEELPKHE